MFKLTNKINNNMEDTTMTNLKNVFFSLILSLGLTTFATNVKAAECGDVSVAEMTWTSAAVLAYFDALVLKEGFGCNTEVVPGDTMPTSISMAEKSQPDIASELWTNGLGAFWKDAVTAGKVQIGGLSMSGGGEAFWIPSKMLEANPELANIEGVLANPQLFTTPESSPKGAFHGCPAGWNCEITTKNLFQAFGFEEAGFVYVDPGSGAALGASAAGAHDKSQGWLGYYWAPTSLLGTRSFQMVSVDPVVQTPENWACATDGTFPGNCEPSYWSKAVIDVAYTTDFANRAPKEVLDYLKNRTFSDSDIGAILDIVEAEAYGPQEAAEYMILERQDLWKDKVSADVANKIIASLQ